MPLEDTGVRLLTQGYNQFMANMSQANNAVANFGKSSTAQLGSLGSSGIKAAQAVDGLVKKIILGNVVAMAAVSAIGKMTQELLRMSSTAIEAAGNLQLLTIRLENLLARQYRMADSTLEVADSLELAKTRTAALVRWMEELALTTPFETKDIAKTFSMSVAMGWAEDSAKDLTMAILNYSAGMGLTNDVIERIIFNFAQMKAAGKVTGTEMRDLARGAFFPLTQVLDEAAKQLGVTASGLQEFRKAAADGSIDIETFFDAFITVVNRDFPDAATKMNFTLEALKNNIKDFFETIVGWELLGKVVAKFALTASNALNKLVAAFRGVDWNEVSKQPYQALAASEKLISGIGWTKLADALVFVFDSITEAAGNFLGAIMDILAALGITAPTVRDVASAFAAFGIILKALSQGFRTFVDNYIVPFITNIKDKLSGIGEDAFSWGANLITQFASGIVKTAATVLTAAMNWISDALANWLAPGSPPKVASEIDEWGKAAMAEFLRGFTLVDFDILDSVQGLMEDALQSLVALGDLDETEFGDLFVNLSEDLIRAIENFRQTGEIGQEIFEQLRDIGGGFGDELAILLERQVALADAIDAAAKAQEELNAAQDATKQATSNVNKLVKEYNALLRAGADQDTLKAKLAQINLAEDDLKLAREREKEAEAAAEAADAALAPLREAVELQERLIKQLVELAKAQADAFGGGGGDDGGGDDDEDPWPEPPTGGIGGMLDDWFDKIKQAMMDKLSSAWEELMEKWKESISGKGEQIKKLLGDLWDVIVSYWNKIVANLIQAWNNFLLFLTTYGPGILENLSSALGTLIGFIVWLALEIGLFLSEVALDWSQWLLDNGPLITTFSGFIAFLATKITELGKAWWEDLKPGLWQWNETFQTGLQTFMEIVSSDSFKKVIENIKDLGIHLGDLFGWLLKLAGVLVEHAIIAFGKWWQDHGDNVATIVDTVTKAIGGLVGTITTDENASYVTEIFDSFLQILGDLIALPIDVLAGDFKKAADEIGRIVSFLTFQEMEGDYTWIEKTLTNIYKAAFALIDLVLGVIETIKKLFNPETYTKDNIIGNVEGAWAKLTKGIGVAMDEGLEAGINSMKDPLKALGKDIGKGTVEAIGEGAGTKSPSTITKQVGNDIMQGLINGLKARLEELKKLAKEIGKMTADATGEGAETGSPSKITYQTGVDIVQGLINGMQDTQSQVEEFVVNMMEDIFDEFDLEDLFKFGGKIGGFGGFIANMFEEQNIDPLTQQAADLDEQIADLQDLIASGTLGAAAQVSAEAELVSLMAQRAALAEDIAAQEQKILEFQEQQQKLEFLKQQMDLLKTIEEFGLDPSLILGGLELGLDASLDELLAAMTRAMEAIVAQAEEDLEAGSPSKVFMRLGKGVVEGFAQGIMGTVGKGQSAINNLLGSAQQQAARGSLAPTMQAQPVMQTQNVSFGNVTINDRMDWATFKNQVQRAVMES